MNETLNGLLTQKPGRDPQQGEIKLFTIEHRKGKSGKPYIKIKNATADMGGQPYRILSAEKTDFVDQHGNISFSVEVEASNSQAMETRSAFQQTKAAMQPPEDVFDVPPHDLQGAPQSPPHAQQGEDGVMEARKHLMQSCNLLNLCIAAVNKAIAPNVPEIAQTSEFFQAQVATLFIEASRAGFVFKMPTVPVPNGKHSATKPVQKEEENGEPPF